MASLPVWAGLDYHGESIRVCVLDADGRTVFNRDVRNDPQVVQLMVGVHGEVQGVAIEACCGAADFATALAELTGWSVRLAHPGYVKRIKQGPDKTDCGDAWLLADLVRVRYLPEVWLADEFTRQLRRLVRHRHGLVAERKAIKLRIRALLREERVPAPKARPWTRAWMAWLRIAELGEQTRWVMEQELKRLNRVEEDIRAVERRMGEATAEDALTQRLLTQRLLTQDGIGPITAVTLRAEIGRFERFRSGKQLARFCGVTPCNASSGKRQAAGRRRADPGRQERTAGAGDPSRPAAAAAGAQVERVQRAAGPKRQAVQRGHRGGGQPLAQVALPPDALTADAHSDARREHTEGSATDRRGVRAAAA